MLLYIDACVRKDSRTRRLAECLLKTLDRPYEEVKLIDCDFPKADEAFITERSRLVDEGSFDDPMFGYARQFAQADEIVIAAPYWDLSFPTILKAYLEQINVTDITFRYTPEGVPEGLCKAQKLYYVTTAGGEFFPEEYGFGYVKALAENFYGIPQVELIKAKRLDLEGEPIEEIMTECEQDIVRRYKAE
ncbi:MAG: NAD(P)H-dependent oxidoreductase [Erysipelotrichaceae bacterium]|nr:NAD(P)H-dependent oxidoreductase [Erysipelotrichaceae bacterium]